MAASATARVATARVPRRSPGIAAPGSGRIRWDRVGRRALLTVLGIILLLYIAPIKHWVVQSRTADAERTQLRELEREHATLQTRVQALRRPGALEREARKLGMVRQGERAYVIENLPPR